MTRKNKLFQKDLAAALRISASMVTRLKQQGMPTNSIAAARRWREDNLSPNLTKDVRGWASETNAASAVRSDPVAHFHHIQTLAGADFEKWRDEMQAAMRAVPSSRRDEVVLNFDLCDRLVAPALARLAAMDRRDEARGVLIADGADSETSDPENIAGHFIYSLACGELSVIDPEREL